jgi:hypothetical protein
MAKCDKCGGFLPGWFDLNDKENGWCMVNAAPNAASGGAMVSRHWRCNDDADWRFFRAHPDPLERARIAAKQTSNKGAAKLREELRGAPKLKAALEAANFKCSADVCASQHNECNWYAYRPTTFEARECGHNEGKRMQIVVRPYLFTHGGVQHSSCSLDVTGEVKGIWVKLEAYSLAADELLQRLPEIEQMLIGAWNGLAELEKSR